MREAALEVLKIFPPEVLRPHLPKILGKALEDRHSDVREAALEVLNGVLTAIGSETVEKLTWDPVAPPLGQWKRLGCIVTWGWKRAKPWVKGVLSVLAFLGISAIPLGVLLGFARTHPTLFWGTVGGALLIILGIMDWAWRKGVCEKARPEAPQCDQETARRKEAVPAPGPRTP